MDDDLQEKQNLRKKKKSKDGPLIKKGLIKHFSPQKYEKSESKVHSKSNINTNTSRERIVVGTKSKEP